MIPGSSFREDNFPVILSAPRIALISSRGGDAMPKAVKTLFRAALCVSLMIITILAVIPLDYPEVAGVNDKFTHVAAFYVLSLLVDFSFPETRLNAPKTLPLLFYGVCIEWIQYYIPYREFSLGDILADAVGITAYAILFPALKYVPPFRSRWDM
jgi:VanZ family protein